MFSILNESNPYKMLFNCKPNYTTFKIFGCACYPLIRPYNKIKVDFRSTCYLFLDYNLHNKGYICLSPTRKTYISWHVMFNEDMFPYFVPHNKFHNQTSNTNNTFETIPPLTILQCQCN